MTASTPPETPELSVIAPCFQEEANVAELTRRVIAVLDRGAIAGELVLVDDGSTDATWPAIEALQLEYSGRVVGRRHGRNLGIAAAWKTGERERAS